MSQLSISPQLSDALEQSWKLAREGERQCIHVEAPLGSGSSHVLSHFQRSVAQECLTWHVRFRDNLYGVELLPALANGL